MRYVVDAQGRPVAASFRVQRSSHALFAHEVEMALPSWRFAPAKRQGQHVAMQYEEVFSFRIPRVLMSAEARQETWADSLAGTVPRTIVPFAERDSSGAARVSMSDYLTAQRAALAVVADLDVRPQLTAADSVALCVSIRRGLQNVPADVATLRALSHSHRRAYPSSSCPLPFVRSSPDETFFQGGVDEKAEVLSPYTVTISAMTAWTQDAVFIWVGTAHQRRRHAYACVATRALHRRSWNAQCALTSVSATDHSG